jgi:hypothetical protein
MRLMFKCFPEHYVFNTALPKYCMLQTFQKSIGVFRNIADIYLANWKGRDLLMNIRRDRRIILKWILEKYGLKLWAEFIWLRTGPSEWRW